MSCTSKFWSRRRLRLALVIILAFLFFHGRLEPRPEFVTCTDRAFESPGRDTGHGIWPGGKRLAHVSGDGRYVVFSGHCGPQTAARTTLFRWDMWIGTEATPAAWADPACDRVLYGDMWRNAGSAHALGHPAAEEWVLDESRLRAAVGRCRALANDRDAVNTSFAHFSPDGRHLIYDLRRGPEDETPRVAIEEVLTGRRVAVLSGRAAATAIAPGGRTAVTEVSDGRIVGDTRCVLWDLESVTELARLEDSKVNYSWFRGYSADGRFAFARSTTGLGYLFGRRSRDPRPKEALGWWDTSTGRLVGTTDQMNDWVLLDCGRTLLVQEDSSGQGANALTFHVWDVATGSRADLWDLEFGPTGAAASVGGLIAGTEGPFVALTFRPDPDAAATTRLEEWIADRFPQPSANTGTRILVVDTERRKPAARLPGESAVFSHNGRWLATLDAAGVLRVYELPLQKPWARILGYTALTTLGFWLVGFVRRFLRSRREAGENPAPAG
jgi:hypothetical protein